MAVILTLLVLSLMFGVVIASAQVDSVVVEDYILMVAIKEKVPAQMVWDIARCESKFNPLAHNTADPNGGSKGVMQFQEKTFYGFAKKYGIESPDIWNPYQQVNLAVYMMRDGLAFHWSCAKKTGHA